METATDGSGPLEDVRVLDLGSVVSGPFCGRLLADLGADGIKVEAPDRPEPLRTWGRAAYQGRKLWWPVHARGKRLITLDLRSARGGGRGVRPRVHRGRHRRRPAGAGPRHARAARRRGDRHLRGSRRGAQASATPGGIRWSGRWEPGTHNAEVYAELLGIEGAQLSDLAEAGTV